ncbi:Limulus clotting factor C [Eumeta japonica]|uniref:Limulus clotting factor C n=1 Tax=Eumeta variegata TaxID=151549 RepID=A0A4C1ZXK7_EUMVA|nr:Limulus clotting factor C [Eumeta japonica]
MVITPVRFPPPVGHTPFALAHRAAHNGFLSFFPVAGENYKKKHKGGSLNAIGDKKRALNSGVGSAVKTVFNFHFGKQPSIGIPGKWFRGGQTNFQDDIALLLLATPFEFNSFVLPACIDFNVKFDREQLRDGNLGTIAGWSLTAVNGRESPILQVVELPYVDVGRCMDEMPPDFRRYITSDKICAGYANGTALCRGDSGGGLTFWIEKKDLKRYYLRGIASTAKHTTNACNALSLTTFTHVLAHEHFIRDYL